MTVGVPIVRIYKVKSSKFGIRQRRACSCLFFRLPSVNQYSNNLVIQSSLPESNGSSMIYNLFEQAVMSSSSASLLLIPDNIHSYTSISLLIILLYIVSVISSILAQWLYSCVSRDQLMRPYRGIVGVF
ncbi:hypothetical protein I4U23_007277 [Adineta vaga]|nr:hypothetical protein I4U23_007277 [Adineta vaga]